MNPVCPAIAQLESLLTGQLAADVEAPLAAHVETCPACQQTLERLTALQSRDGSSGVGLERLRALLPTEPVTPPVPVPGWPDVPGYEILEELGRGGMGVVYKAWQTGLGRVVALKVVAAERATPEQLARFRAEAETAARLQHPNIVAVHEVGTHSGRPYFAMEFVEGGTLEQRLGGRPLPPREAAELIRVLARAVHHAHGCGVVHRDLKPANILLAGKSEIRNPKSEMENLLGSVSNNEFRASNFSPKVSDFGLAKRLEADLRLTDTGAVLGTPSFMAPEQVRGGSGVGPPADIYALGATLYALVSGRPPFLAATPMETVRQVMADEPVPPRRLQPTVPRDLEAVCLKCLEKDPRRRYATAGALADDLGRFLDGRPTAARPVGLMGRAWRWARRRPTLALAYGLGLLAVILGLGGGGALALWQRAEVARQGAENARTEAEKARGLTDAALVREGEARDKLDQVLYLHRVQLAYREWLASSLPRWRQYLDECDPRRRGWEWYYVDRLGRPLLELQISDGKADNAICGLAYSPDGTSLATACMSGSIRLWDARTGKERFLLEGTERRVLRPVPIHVTFTPNGRRVVSSQAQSVVTFWDADTGRVITRIAIRPLHRIGCLAVSPDGSRLAVGVGWKISARLPDDNDPRVRLWDIANAQGQVLTGHKGAITDVAFSPDGSRLVSAANDGVVKVWNAESGEEVATLPVLSSQPLVMAFRPPDGKQVASCSGGRTVSLWDVEKKQEVFRMMGTAGIDALAFSPDGSLLATGNSDGTITLRDAGTGQLRGTLGAHFSPEARIRAVCFSPDGKRLASYAARDGVVKIWDVTATLRTLVRLAPLPDKEGLVSVLSADGQRLAVTTPEGTLRLFDRDSGKETVATGHTTRVKQVAFSPDGNGLASVADDKTVRVWDTRTGRERRAFRWDATEITAVALGPDGNLLAIGNDRAEVKVWDVATGREASSPGHIGSRTFSLLFSPDGRLLAAGDSGGTLWIWHTTTGQKALAEQMAFTRNVPYLHNRMKLAFSRDSRLLATVDNFGEMRVFETASGKQLSAFGPRFGWARGLAFSPRGDRLASISFSSREIKLWDWSAGQEALTFDAKIAPLPETVAFDLSGRLIVASSMAYVRVWDPNPLPAR